MPCKSVKTDFDDAKLVTDTFGVKFIKVDLKDTLDALESSINNNLHII